MSKKPAAAPVEAPPEITYGTGRFVFPDGSVYEGSYATCKGVMTRSGEGSFSCPQWTYRGAWKDDKMQGQGEWVSTSGARYVGAFLDNRYHGEGRYTWPASTTSSSGGAAPEPCYYQGAWVDGRMHGAGSYVDAASGIRYEGEFASGFYLQGKAHVVVRTPQA